MKYSFFSSACAWLPSALMMAVSASGASSAPLASFVRYVPAEMKNKHLYQGKQIRSSSAWRLLPEVINTHLKTTWLILHYSYTDLRRSCDDADYVNEAGRR